MTKKILRFVKSKLVIALSTAKEFLVDAKIQLFHTRLKFMNIIDGEKPKHLVISGFPRSGTTMFYNMIRSSLASKAFLPDKEMSALSTIGIYAENIVTKRPLDILNIEEIDKKLGSIREITHIVLIRDPRDLVSSKHDSVPNQYFQGYDYQFFVRPGFKSISGPGINAVANAINKAIDEKRRVIFVKYEDLIKDPDAVKNILESSLGFSFKGSFTSFHKDNIPEDLKIQLNGVRSIKNQTKPAWTLGERYQRALQQLKQFPELEELAVNLGYPSTKEMKKSHNLPNINHKIKRGTIVAFHTDDEIYTNEAARCRNRLEHLGLSHDFTIVKKKGDWVQNCALKPDFLLDVRKRIRGPLLYIDVDAFVHKDPWPHLTGYEGDMAAYIHGDGELLSGTLLLNDTKATEFLLEEWVKRQIKQPKTYDQKVLQDIIEEDEKIEKDRYCFQRLPLNFCYINDKYYPYKFGEPIIEHLQASRIAKLGMRNQEMAERVDELNKISTNQF